MEILPLERELMNALLAGDDPALDVLRRQFTAASVSKRDYTGPGFFTYFSIPSDAPRSSTTMSLQLRDVIFDLAGRSSGGDALLWLKDGALDSLEALAHDGEWPQGAQVECVRYFSGQERDLAFIRGTGGG